MRKGARRGRARTAQLTALSPSQAATVLTRACGTPVTAAMIQEDIAAGAPVNPDGTLHMIHYAAWLVKGLADGV